jgi:predicted AAA+ superfamily ATPase
MYYRHLQQEVSKISKTFPVLVVTGPRQVGKTTLLKMLSDENRKYVTLDDPNDRLLAKEDPKLFLERYSPPVLIDEIQYAPELLPYIKIHVDNHKKEGDYWLTGSKMFRLMENVQESLAGRAGVLRMFSFTNSEILRRNIGPIEFDKDSLLGRENHVRKQPLMDIFDTIFRGGMPRLYENLEVDPKRYFESYLDTYISRDIRELKQITDELSFLKFVQVVAARTATNVNYTVLANEVGISVPTAQKWLSLLVTSGIIILIPPFFNNALKRVVKASRVYFLDTGLCCHLLKVPSAPILEASNLSGQLFETWVISEIYKNYINTGIEPPMYFYRDSNRKEIDVVIQSYNLVHLFEIKKSSAPRNAIKNFSVMKPISTPIGLGGVLCLSENLFPIDHLNWMIPVWMI